MTECSKELNMRKSISHFGKSAEVYFREDTSIKSPVHDLNRFVVSMLV